MLSFTDVVADRSIKYAEDTIAMYRSTVNKESSITSDGGIFSQIR